MSKVFSKIAMALLLAVSCFLVTGCGESATPPAEPPATEAGSGDAGMEEKAGMEEGSEAKKEDGSGSH